MAAWNPFEEMDSLRREIDRAFDEVGSSYGPSHRVAFLPARGPRQYPLINLLEDRDNLYVEALTPGVNPDSLNLTVVQDHLTISGEKSRVPSAVKPEEFHRSERASGKFMRTIELPVEVDDARISATLQSGLLIVTLPKAEKAKPKQIQVKVA